MRLRGLIPLFAVAVLTACAATALADLPGLARDFTYKHSDGAVDVLKDGKTVARYVYTNTPKPCVHPISAPSGEAVTRNFPMKTVAGEPQDHPHHRSFWIGFGDVNGVDFWSEGDKSGKIVQTSIDFEPASPGYWAIHTKNDWIGPDDKKVCEDERRVSFLSCDYGTVVSTVIRLTSDRNPITLGDSKEGFFAFRVAPGMQLKDGKGHILNSAGDKDLECWGKRARWCDYTGEVNGKTCGITVFDSPYNYNFPTYWHVRDYGLFAANPFGTKDFTSDPNAGQPYKIERYESLVLVYIALIHDGKLDAQTIDKIADEAAGKGPGPLPSDDGIQPDNPDQQPLKPLGGNPQK